MWLGLLSGFKELVLPTGVDQEGLMPFLFCGSYCTNEAVFFNNDRFFYRKKLIKEEQEVISIYATCSSHSILLNNIVSNKKSTIQAITV